MDSQKDVQPPKQQPMIYICGGNENLRKINECPHTLEKKTRVTAHYYNCIANDALNQTLAMSVCLLFPNVLSFLFVMYIKCIV